MTVFAERKKLIQHVPKVEKGVVDIFLKKQYSYRNFVVSYKRFFLSLLVAFALLGHDNNGRTWNLYGPDRSGTYGGAQGIGGLEVTWQLSGNVINGILNNYFGDSLGTINSSGTSTSYNGVLGGYGPMPGYSFPGYLDPFTQQWRGHYLDWTGFYYMGARYYEPNSGRFLSPDPLGHDASLSLYDYCDGDPVNGLDADGRCPEDNGMPVGPVSNQYLFNPDRAPMDLQLNQGQSQNPFTSRFTSSGVAIDYDGDPMAYAPAGSGLVGRDDLKNAKLNNGELNSNVIAFSRNHQPLINSSGYYLSTTSLYHGNPSFQENNVNANAIPYIAFGGQQTAGARYGDYVYIHNDTTGVGKLAIYADYRGDANNQGIEISEESARQLGIKFNRDNGVMSNQSVTATIYPGSRLAPFATPHLPSFNSIYY